MAAGRCGLVTQRDDLLPRRTHTLEPLQPIDVFRVVRISGNVVKRRTEGVFAILFDLLMGPGMLRIEGQERVNRSEYSRPARLQRLVEVDPERLRNRRELGERMQ